MTNADKIDLLSNLDKVLSLIDETSQKQGETFPRFANTLRLYYLGLNQIFVTKKILAETNFSNFQINNQERAHLENAGWLLDSAYYEDSYIPALRMNLLFDLWASIPKSEKESESFKTNPFFQNYKILIDSCLKSNAMEAENTIDFSELEISVQEGGSINFITPENILNIAKKLIEEYETQC